MVLADGGAGLAEGRLEIEDPQRLSRDLQHTHSHDTYGRPVLSVHDFPPRLDSDWALPHAYQISCEALMIIDHGHT